MEPVGVAPHALDAPPTVRVGALTREQEAENREVACETVALAGAALGLGVAAVTTAQVSLQRFYYRVSMRTHSVVHAVMAALLVASKAGEEPRSVREVVSAVDRVLARRRGEEPGPPLQRHSDRYYGMAAAAKVAESAMLRELGFHVWSEPRHPPHAFVAYYARVLRVPDRVARLAWGAASDAARTDAPFRATPAEVACGALRHAAALAGVALPEGPPHSPAPWWELFDARAEAVALVAGRVAAMAARGRPARYVPVDSAGDDGELT